MEPPPSAPRLADFPPLISDLFIRAFTRAGANDNRASANEWIASLVRLSKNLKQCEANRSHQFSITSRLALGAGWRERWAFRCSE
jgi:DNA-binding helix-hairpin-helix protein with protein kinase domain